MIRLEEAHGVVLRRFEPFDVDHLYGFRNDRHIAGLLGGFSLGYSRADLEEWVDFHRGRNDELLFAIADPDGKLIGHVGLYQIDHRVRKGEFAIVIGDPEWQGRGVGKAVSSKVVDLGFRELNLNKIVLSVLAPNIRARHLYASLGFREEGVLREDQFRDGEYIDVVQMSILEREWRTRE